MRELILSFVVWIYTETDIFIMTKLIATTAANICSFSPTDFAYGLCQELGIYQAIGVFNFLFFLVEIQLRTIFLM